MIGIVTVVLSVLATIAWILLLALVDWDEIDDSTTTRSTATRSTTTSSPPYSIRLAAAAIRLVS